MSKRQKTVFSSNSQLSHVWAQCTQEYGKANSMFFEGRKVYSYGYHYLAGEIHEGKAGKRFALIRGDTFSSSTSQHLSNIRGAAHGLMPIFLVDGSQAVSDPRKAIACLDSKIEAAIENALNRVYFSDSRWAEVDDGSEEVNSHLERIQDAIKEANEFRALIGRAAIRFPQKRIDAAREHLEKLRANYNSPARVAKRQAKAEEKRIAREKARAERAEEQAEAIENFHAGRRYGYIDLDHELLRIKGNRIETSRGAEVSLREARAMLALADRDGPFSLIGKQIGEFTVTDVSDYRTNEGDDVLLGVGCHRILLSEARRVLGRALTLVTA